jgi:predicted TIM-barrel fold metal-dependent hydrolase
MQPDFEIIDAHIHAAPSAEWSSCWYRPFESAEADVADLRAAGVTRACGAAIKRTKTPDLAHMKACNEAGLEFHRLFPDFYIPAMQVHPHYPEESCREMERLHRDHGVRWIGELVGYMHGYGEEFASKGAFKIYDLAQQLGMVVSIHCQDLAIIAKACKAFPDLPFVLAHFMNDKESFLPRAQLTADLPNLHMDTSGSGVHRWGSLEYGVRKAGARKFLFGSDFPINAPATYVACVLREHISDDDRRAIFSGNFKRLMRME